MSPWEAVVYARSGVGRPLVLVHGLGQDHQIWADVQNRLLDYTTFAYDLRGHGGTPLGEADGTIRQLAEDLVTLLEVVGPAVCIGFSLGGAIALRAAAEHPDLVDGVVAIATSSIVGRSAEAALLDRIDLVNGGDRGRIRTMLRDDTRSQLVRRDADVDQIAELRLVALGDPRGYVNGARAVCSMRIDSLHDLLPRIAVPVLVVSGEHDTWCPRRAADLMLENLSQGSYAEIRGVGHLVTDEAPDTLVDQIRSWINTVRWQA
jgi:pimeloyl-ACP methyl ester carboxylesterase